MFLPNHRNDWTTGNQRAAHYVVDLGEYVRIRNTAARPFLSVILLGNEVHSR